MKNKLLVIAGASASGKTALAISLAKKYDAEIISVDSVQFYQGLDIGSAKVSTVEMEGIKHHLIDHLNYKQSYSIMEFINDAKKIIEDIIKRDKKVILCGGSALYLHALLYNYQLAKEEKNQELIAELESFSEQQLLNLLSLVDYDSYLVIDQKNRRRVMRALISAYHGNLVSQKAKYQIDQPYYDYLMIYLIRDKEELRQRIILRVEKMMEEGLLEEISQFYTQDQEIFNYQAFRSIGYLEFQAYFKQEKDLMEVKEEIIQNTIKLAKRQRTFFQNKFKFEKFEPKNQEIEEILEKIEKFWVK